MQMRVADVHTCCPSPEGRASACFFSLVQVLLPRLFVGMQQLTSLKIIGSTGSVLEPSVDLPAAAQHLTALRSLSYTGRVHALPSRGFDLQPGMLPPTLQVCVCVSAKNLCVCVKVAHATKVHPSQPAVTAPDTQTRFRPTASPCCVCVCLHAAGRAAQDQARVPPVHRSRSHIVCVWVFLCFCFSVPASRVSHLLCGSQGVRTLTQTGAIPCTRGASLRV